MWKWILGAVVVLGLVVCMGGVGAGAWWWLGQAQAERAAESARVALADSLLQEEAAKDEAARAREARFVEGRAAAAAGDHARAVDAFGAALDGDEQNAEALLGRGRAYARLERFDLAEEDLRVATRQAPTDREAWESLGWVLGQMGRDSEAVDALDRLVALDGADPEAWRDRANARYRAGDIPGARGDAARACELGLEDGCVLEKRIAAATGR